MARSKQEIFADLKEILERAAQNLAPASNGSASLEDAEPLSPGLVSTKRTVASLCTTLIQFMEDSSVVNENIIGTISDINSRLKLIASEIEGESDDVLSALQQDFLRISGELDAFLRNPASVASTMAAGIISAAKATAKDELLSKRERDIPVTSASAASGAGSEEVLVYDETGDGAEVTTNSRAVYAKVSRGKSKSKSEEPDYADPEDLLDQTYEVPQAKKEQNPPPLPPKLSSGASTPAAGRKQVPSRPPIKPLKQDLTQDSEFLSVFEEIVEEMQRGGFVVERNRLSNEVKKVSLGAGSTFSDRNLLTKIDDFSKMVNKYVDSQSLGKPSSAGANGSDAFASLEAEGNPALVERLPDQLSIMYIAAESVFKPFTPPARPHMPSPTTTGAGLGAPSHHGSAPSLNTTASAGSASAGADKEGKLREAAARILELQASQGGRGSSKSVPSNGSTSAIPVQSVYLVDGITLDPQAKKFEITYGNSRTVQFDVNVLGKSPITFISEKKVKKAGVFSKDIESKYDRYELGNSRELVVYNGKVIYFVDNSIQKFMGFDANEAVKNFRHTDKAVNPHIVAAFQSILEPQATSAMAASASVPRELGATTTSLASTARAASASVPGDMQPAATEKGADARLAEIRHAQSKLLTPAEILARRKAAKASSAPAVEAVSAAPSTSVDSVVVGGEAAGRSSPHPLARK